MGTGKRNAFWPLLCLLVLADCSTKRLAEQNLPRELVPHDVIGDVVRFTLAYNPGAAFNFSLGPNSRWWFTLLATGVLVVLIRLYHETAAHDRAQASALALVAGGALGNALDRLRSPRGVVDFIDIGVGDVRFWTFNVADVCVTFGAIFLGVILLRRGAAGRAHADT
jgi:signal peptidase II